MEDLVGVVGCETCDEFAEQLAIFRQWLAEARVKPLRKAISQVQLLNRDIVDCQNQWRDHLEGFH